MDFFQYVKDELHICLNQQQKDAVQACDKRILLEACPGSGKTTTLVARIAYLILCRGVSPSDILTLTFSRASAMDMEKRFQNLFGSLIITPVHFSTIHSFCYRFLRYCQKKGILMVPELLEKQAGGGKYKILKKIYYDVNEEYLGDDEAEVLSNEIGFVKNKMADPGEFKSSFHDFAVIFQKYAAHKKERKRIDFDDMLSMTYAVLCKNRSVYTDYGEFSFVHVDEAQDTSIIQHKIIEILSWHGNLFMVGDTDQSIYGFRGAEPEYIVNIQKQFPDARIMRLETNYRTTGHIVALADQFIRQNLSRHPKEMNTQNEGGKLPQILYAKNKKEQWTHVMRMIDTDPNQFTAVLFRNNISGLPFAYELIKKGVLFYIREKYSNFFKSFILSDVFFFFRFSTDFHDLPSFTKIYYKLGAPIKKDDILYLNELKQGGTDIFSALFSRYWRKKNIREHLVRIQRAFGKIQRVPPYKALCIMEKDLGYGEYLKRKTGCRDIFQTLKYLAEGTKTLDEYKTRLRTLKNGIAYCYQKKEAARVHLLTLHGSKGLEFDRVILIDLIDGQFPAEKVLDAMAMGDRKLYEEEARLFYVGVTRARTEILLIAPQKIEEKTVRPSRFIDQFLAKENGIELRKDQKIYHQRFGEGIVLDCKGDIIVVQFKQYGRRKLSAHKCIKSELIQFVKKN